MNTHAGLTEAVVSDSLRTHRRKGTGNREGNREVRTEGPIHRYGLYGSISRRMDDRFAARVGGQR